MDPHVATVRQAAYRAAAGLGVATLAVTVADLLRFPSAYRPGVGMTAALAIGVVLLAAIREGLRPHPSPRPLAVFVVASYLLLLAHPLLVLDPPRYPPLLHVLGGGMCVTAIAFSVRFGAVGAVAFSLVSWWLRMPVLGPWSAATEASLLALSGAISTATIYVLVRATAQVTTAVEAEWTSRERATRAARRGLERVRWDGLTHDKVLGALLLAGRTRGGAVPEAAGDLAREALAAMAEPERAPGRRPAEPAVLRWRRHAGRLGLRAHVEVAETEVDPEVADAVVDVVAEALTNVARHGGPGQAWVSGTIGPQRVQVVVTDTGPGFSFDRDRRRASGLETMVRRMRTVGGTAELTSRPGRGTVVTVRWSPAAPDTAESSRTEWTRRTFTPLLTLGALVVILNVGLGADQWRGSRSVGVALVGIAAIVAVTVGAGLLPPTSRLFGVTVVALVVTGTVLAANAAPAAPSDWRYWGVGALTPALGAVAFRCPGRHGAAAAGALMGLVAVTDALLGRPFWAVLAGPGSVLVLTVVAGYLLRLALDRSWTLVDRSVAATGVWRMATAAEGERVEEAIRRVEALDAAAGAALRLVADATELTNEQAEELLVVESAVRDALTAPGLLTPAVREAVLAARRRGARVEVRRTIAGAGVTPDQPLPEAAVAAFSAAVGEARAGDAVRLSWRPADTRLPVVLTYVGQDADSVATRIRRSLGGLGSGGPEVSTDADSVLVEIHGPAPAG